MLKKTKKTKTARGGGGGGIIGVKLNAVTFGLSSVPHLFALSHTT